MRKAPFVLLAALWMTAAFAFAGNHSHTHGISTSNSGDVRSCGDIEVTMNDLPVARAEQKVTAPASSTPIHVEAAHNGGVYLIRGEGNEIVATVCKFAASDQESRAQQTLSQINASLSGDKITVTGPDSDSNDWTAFLIVQVPNGAALDVRAFNGPISARQINGNVTIKTTNGPISLKDCSGTVSADATNGPISFSGNGGQVSVHTQNGPISVSLDGNSWDQGSLEARAQNGPISLNIPENFTSGVLVESDGHSPMSCKAAACSNARKTWDEDVRRIEFGANPVVKMSTVNGPVSVHDHQGAL